MTKNNKVKEQPYIVGYYGGRLFPGVKKPTKLVQRVSDMVCNGKR